MEHIYDRATMARALTLDLDPSLRELLTTRFAALVTPTYDLTDLTEYLIVDQSADTEADILRHIGMSPLVEPIDGNRFGVPGFHPFWDYLAHHPGWYEMIIGTGSSFAYVLFIRDAEDMLPTSSRSAGAMHESLGPPALHRRLARSASSLLS